METRFGACLVRQQAIIYDIWKACEAWLDGVSRRIYFVKLPSVSSCVYFGLSHFLTSSLQVIVTSSRRVSTVVNENRHAKFNVRETSTLWPQMKLNKDKGIAHQIHQIASGQTSRAVPTRPPATLNTVFAVSDADVMMPSRISMQIVA